MGINMFSIYRVKSYVSLFSSIGMITSSSSFTYSVYYISSYLFCKYYGKVHGINISIFVATSKTYRQIAGYN